MDDALTPAQVAAELGVTARTVQRWIRGGRLPARRIGGRFRVSPSSLETLRGGAWGTAAEPDAGERSAIPPTAAIPPIAAIRPIRSLLIANRGEIVPRIARTARALGMRVIGLHTADDHPPRGVDAAHLIDSHLDAAAILAVAHHAGADAIHPGYGFLAESAAFAAGVASAGIRWVGPPASAIAAMGDKAAARRQAIEAGVPVVAGYDSAAQDDATLATAAGRIGYPVLVKPRAGGGGKGMQVVRGAERLVDALASARREATRSFGDDRLILERFVERGRHVEIQVLFDAHGAGVHLGERDCSAQRRYQKVLEEAPGPTVDASLRERMGAAALSLAAAVGYVSAGTVEFLLADDGTFAFLEMNTRLQVEHPVTEAVTGRDLVADQLRIAAGEPLGVTQRDVRLRGHAIEARLYAEDPEAGFLPATGRVLHLRWPDGDGIRVDAGIVAGDVIADRFDPMLAKIVAHGRSRPEALARLHDALGRTELLGVTTNLRFLRWLLDRPAVVDGEVRTATLAALGVPHAAQPSAAQWAAAAAAAMPLVPGGAWGGAWRLNATPTIALVAGDETRRIPLAADPPPATLTSLDAAARTVHVDLDGRSVAFRIAPPPTVESALQHAAAASPDHALLTAPMPGRVVALRATRGARLAATAVVVVIEAMKMEHGVVTPIAGTVTRLSVAVGDQVQRGDVVAEISASDTLPP